MALRPGDRGGTRRRRRGRTGHAAWEIAENSPVIIDRYRTATLSLAYYGDSVMNSVTDVVAMMVGVWMARRLPLWGTVAFVVLVGGIFWVWASAYLERDTRMAGSRG